MDVIEAIKNRRSVRKFKKDPVSEEILMELIEAARLAPSGKNLQPYKFKIITKPQDKELMREHQVFFQDFVYTAPVLILCCFIPDDYVRAGYGGTFDYNRRRCLVSMSIAAQNIVLRATELGLGTCYIGDMRLDVVERLFLPEDTFVSFAICLGYSDDNSPWRRKKDHSELILKD